jgi:hypothetical protein
VNLSDSISLAFFTILLTLLVNIIFKGLQNKFDFMVDTKKFRRDHYYNQLKELYFEIYAIIVQSEFLRTFHQIGEFRSLQEVPFIEIEKKLKNIKKIYLPEELWKKAKKSLKVQSLSLIKLVWSNSFWRRRNLLLRIY